jgi:hypothetical protein
MTLRQAAATTAIWLGAILLFSGFFGCAGVHAETNAYAMVLGAALVAVGLMLRRRGQS